MTRLIHRGASDPMKLVFVGLEKPVELAAGECTTLEVANSTLFTRVACSLMSGEGRYAQEPYSIWEGDAELRPKDVLLVIDNPLRLPRDDKCYTSGLFKQMEREYLEDEELRRIIDELQRNIESRLLSLTLGMNADVEFGTEWELKRYLKFIGSGVDYKQGKTYPPRNSIDEDQQEAQRDERADNNIRHWNNSDDRRGRNQLIIAPHA